jgi:hypothetical protein
VSKQGVIAGLTRNPGRVSFGRGLLFRHCRRIAGQARNDNGNDRGLG